MAHPRLNVCDWADGTALKLLQSRSQEGRFTPASGLAAINIDWNHSNRQSTMAPIGRTLKMKRVIRKPRTCSACGSKVIAKIVYGLPYFSEEENRQVELGKIVLGGCVRTDDDPTWECVECGRRFWKDGRAD